MNFIKKFQGLSIVVLGSLAFGSIPFSPEILSGKEKLTLNGVGERTATIFKVTVYEAGLYVKEKSNDVSKIILQYPKKMELHFARGVDKEDIAKNLEKSFTANCEKKCETQSNALNQLKNLFISVKENDKMIYSFLKDKVELFHNDQKLGEVMDPNFSENLILTWLGKEPPNEGLKKGLLGQKD